MKEILHNVLILCHVVTIIGALGFPFISLTVCGVMAIRESLEDLDYYGIDGFIKEKWCNRHDRLLSSFALCIFPICTLVTLGWMAVKLFGP